MSSIKRATLLLGAIGLILLTVLTSCTSAASTTSTTTSTSVQTTLPAQTSPQATATAPTTTTSPTARPTTPTTQPTTTVSTATPTTTSTIVQSTTATPTKTVDAHPTGGVLNIIKSTVPNTLGPIATMGAPGAVFLMPALEALVGIDTTGPVPTKLATSWEIGADGKSLTLHLKKGVKFHDLTDFDASAVKFNFDQRIGARPEVNAITSVDVIDDYTVRLNLKSYSNTLLYQLGWIGGMMESPTAVKTHEKDWFGSHMVGTGPFEFVSYTRDVSLVFKKFSNYWDSGKPYLDGLKYTFIVDPMTAEAYFRANAGQMWDQILPSSLRNISNMGNPTNVVPRTIWMAISDSANPSSPFAKKEVRQALDYAIDKKAVVDTFGLGTWEVPNGPISAKQFGSIPDFKGRTYDAKKARQLLVDAGYPNGFNTNLYARDNVDRNVIVAFQAYLKAIGINAEIRPVTTAAYQTLRERGWNGILMVNMGIVGSYAKMLQTDGPTKTSAVSAVISDGYLVALNKAMEARDRDSELKLNQELVQFVFDEAIMIPWLIDSVIAVYDMSIHVDINTVNLQNWNPGDSWITK